MNMQDNFMLSVMERILRNQYILLTASNVQNFMDREHKEEIFEITSAEAADTRLMIEDVQKTIKKNTTK
jgi:hypothetical protein